MYHGNFPESTVIPYKRVAVSYLVMIWSNLMSKEKDWVFRVPVLNIYDKDVCDHTTTQPAMYCLTNYMCTTRGRERLIQTNLVHGWRGIIDEHLLRWAPQTSTLLLFSHKHTVNVVLLIFTIMVWECSTPDRSSQVTLICEARAPVTVRIKPNKNLWLMMDAADLHVYTSQYI